MRSIYRRRIDTYPRGYEVRNQGRGNRCPVFTVGNGWDVLRARYLAANPGAIVPDAACMAAFYYFARKVQGQPGDIGAHFYHLQTALESHGMPTGAWDDFGDLSFANEPSPAVVAAGLANRPLHFAPVRWITAGPSKDSVPETVAMYLSRGNPLPCIAMLSSDFWDIYNRSSLLAARYRYDPTDKRGEHAVLLTGVDQDNGVYEFVNSYGPDYGYQGRFTMDFAQFGAAITQVWALEQSLIPLVPEHNIMTNPVPQAVPAEILVGYFTKIGVKAQLQQAYADNMKGNWQQAILNKAAEHKVPAKVVEILAKWPENIIEDFVNRGLAEYPAELFYV